MLKQYPFGLKTDIPVYLDESLRKLEWVYPAAGTDNSAVRLQINELEKVSKAISLVNMGK